MRTNRNHSLDLVRGLAAIGVANYHFLTWNYSVEVQSLGTFFVYVFFVLSGLTMMMVYGDRFSDRIDRGPCAAFFKNRVARLFPLLAAVALASLLFETVTGGYSRDSIPKAFLTASGLMGFHMPGLVSNSVGAWSLGVEVVFYALFPIIALLAAKCRLQSMFWTVVVLLLGQHAMLAIIAPIAGPKDHWAHYVMPLTFAPFFAIGIGIWRLPLASRKYNLVIALALLIALGSFSLLVNFDIYRSPLLYLLLTAWAGLTIAFAYSSELPIRAAPFAKFIGEISYAVYLTHWMTNILINKVASVLHLSPVAHCLVFNAAICATGYGIFRLFELPAQTWIRRSWKEPTDQTVLIHGARFDELPPEHGRHTQHN